MLTDDELAEQLERSGQRADENAQRLQRNGQARASAHERIATIVGTAETPDGGLRATVGVDGTLTQLESVSGAGPIDQRLADGITQLVRDAVANAHTQIRAVYEDLLNEGIISELPAPVKEYDQQTPRQPEQLRSLPPGKRRSTVGADRSPNREEPDESIRNAPPPEPAARPTRPHSPEPRHQEPASPTTPRQRPANRPVRPIERSSDDEPEEEVFGRWMKKGWH